MVLLMESLSLGATRQCCIVNVIWSVAASAGNIRCAGSSMRNPPASGRDTVMRSQAFTHGVPLFATAAILRMSLAMTAVMATFLGLPAATSRR